MEKKMEQKKNITGPAGIRENTNKIPLSLTGKITANPVVSCRIEGEEGALLFNPDTDSTLLINPTGILVWNFIGQTRTVEEIVEYVTRSYTSCPDPASLRKDIESFVTDLVPDFIAEA
jgi:hypothetical protein